MKKILATLIGMVAIAATAAAQKPQFEEKNLSFMGLFGMNISNMQYKHQPGMELNPKAGLNLGIRAEYMLPAVRGLFVNAGLEYGMKGGRSRIYGPFEDMGGVYGTYIARPCYLSIPIHVGYRYDIDERVGIYADFGPYFAVGTNGNFRTKYDDYSEDYTESIFAKEDGVRYYKRFDCGIGLRFGAEYAQHYNFILGLDWGLTDMYTQNAKHFWYESGYHDVSCKNYCASLTLGYRF